MAEVERRTAEELGVPAAEFIEDVDLYMKGKQAEPVLKELQDRYQQYKLAESRLQQMTLRLNNKVPDLKKGLEMVKLLIQRAEADEDTLVDYQLSDNVYAKAKIVKPKTVNLWLGANVMLEYTLAEAEELLTKNLANAQENLENTRRDSVYLRDQVTVTEVSMARVYNYDVKRRREAAAGEKEED